jgi:phage shock protein PspC (stress-responsive transcriptional regulator)
MKKVININFQGRVVPIEETAYDILKQYVDSLSRFFANEEGKDEIINDIEDRIAELFSEVLKKGSTCITDDDVNTIIASMGRPEEFEAEEASVKSQLGAESSQQSQQQQPYTTTTPHRLYRDENRKILAGVCSGLANYFNIDVTVVRVLFLIFFGVTFIPYLILWVAVPSSASVQVGSRRKKLFRDPDEKVIAGVCSGLASYFGVNVWIPRLLFLIPFFTFVFRWSDGQGFWGFPHFLSFSFSPGSLFVYIILWLVLPEAKTAADKLEMKGEKVDLTNIKNTVQSDLGGFKDKAQQFGSDVKDRVQEIGKTVGEKGKQFTSEAATVAKKGGTSIGDVIIFLVKLFAYFIIGSVLIGIVVGLFSLGVVFSGLIPVHSTYVLNEGWQTFLAWVSLILFIWVPVIGIITFIIRRLAKKRSHSLVIRGTFIALWLIGLFSFIALIMSVYSDFKYRNNPVEEAIVLSNPGVDKLEINAANFNKFRSDDWFRMEPFASFEEDTVFVRNLRLRIIKSLNDSFQVTMVKLANGKSRQEANANAGKIAFNVSQRDSVLTLDKGIPVNRTDKFRNQHVAITVAVPVGKRIVVNHRVGWDDNVNVMSDHDWDWWYSDDQGTAQRWRHGVEYIMTASGLERVDKKKTNEWGDVMDEDDKERLRNEIERNKREIEEKERKLRQVDSPYRYKPVEGKKAAPADKTTALPSKNTNTASHFLLGDIVMMRFGS